MFLNISLIHKLANVRNLRVIENAKLRELVAKGPQYRGPNRVNWKATETMFLESIDLYAKSWSKTEQVELKYLSESKDQFKELVADRISKLKGHFTSPKCKVLDQPDVKGTLHKLLAIYILVPADKTANNVIVVCKKYYIDTLVKELRINTVNSNNPTYIPTDDSFETIRKSHSSSHQWDWKCLRKIKIYHICTGLPSCINHHTDIGV